MKAFGLFTHGMLDFAKEEIAEILNSKILFESENTILFEVDSYEKIAKLCYESKSFYKIGLVLQHKKFDEIDFQGDYSVYLEDVDLSIFDRLDLKSHSMATKVKTRGVQLNVSDYERGIGGTICTKYDISVNLKNPSLPFYCFIDEYILIGLDFSVTDLTKREYKLHNNMNTIKGNFAFAAARFSQIEDDFVVLDPFCDVGTMMIESYLDKLNLSVNHYRKNIFGFNKFSEIFSSDFNLEKYDQKRDVSVKYFGYDSLLKNILFAQKNAKVMGVKEITFSRVNVEDIDLKHEANSVDLILSNITFSLKNNHKKIEILFDQANDILKENGSIVLIGKSLLKLKELAEEYDFVFNETKEFHLGKEKYDLIRIIRN